MQLSQEELAAAAYVAVGAAAAADDLLKRGPDANAVATSSKNSTSGQDSGNDDQEVAEKLRLSVASLCKEMVARVGVADGEAVAKVLQAARLADITLTMDSLAALVTRFCQLM